jgi:hypothetical protein
MVGTFGDVIPEHPGCRVMDPGLAPLRGSSRDDSAQSLKGRQAELETK